MPGATAVAPKLSVPTISLADAVTQTVTNQPQIKLGIQSVATRTGSVQRERGAFDWRLILAPNYEYSNTALDPAVRGDEKNRRLKFQVVAAGLRQHQPAAARSDQQSAAASAPVPVDVSRDRPRQPRPQRLQDHQHQRVRRHLVHGRSSTLRKTISCSATMTACVELDDASSVGRTMYTHAERSRAPTSSQRMFGLATGAAASASCSPPPASTRA
jgi:hypothetical protein